MSDSDQIIRDYACAFKAVTTENIKEHMYFADLQMFWPDKKQLFPWEKGVDLTCREEQPDLSS